MRIKETITLPNGQKIEVLNYIPICQNCGVPADEVFCSPCHYLAFQAGYRVRMWGETEGLVNRRWQMRFAKGQLEPQVDTSVKWEQKRKFQDW